MLQIIKEYIKDKYKIDIINDQLRKREIIRCKAAAINIMYWYFNNTMVELAKAMKYDCHTTILHHIKEHKGKYTYDSEYADIYDDIKKLAFKYRPDVVGGLDHIIDALNQIENA